MILAIDTCMPSCSAALWHDGQMIAGRCEAMNTGHAERLVPMIGEILDEAGLEKAGGIVVTTGPGTFTGQRVGLSVARGLMLGWGVPGVGVSCFEALAVAAPDVSPDTLHVGFDARRDQIYWQSFVRGPAGYEPVAPPDAVPTARARELYEARPGLLIGTAAPLFEMGAAQLPDARLFGRLWGTVRPGPDRLVRPLYLRAPDAKLPHNAPPARGEAPGP